MLLTNCCFSLKVMAAISDRTLLTWLSVWSGTRGSLYTVLSSSHSIRFARAGRRLGQFLAKWPTCPQLKQALLPFPASATLALWFGWKHLCWLKWLPPLKLPLSPLLQFALPTSIATSWLFHEEGAFEELYWCHWLYWGADYPCFGQRGCYFQRIVLCFGVVDMGFLFWGTSFPILVGLLRFRQLFLLFVRILEQAGIVRHLQPGVL